MSTFAICLPLIGIGMTSKQIAFELALSSKTVDVHRHNIMTKLQVDSQMELGRMAETLLSLKRRFAASPSPSPRVSR